MQSLAQAIPATIVALFVFTLGALVGIAQLSINAYGHRAALMLIEDHAVAVSVIRPLVLAVVALLLAGQIPDSGDPPEAVTAGFATLALLTVFVIVQSVGLLGATLLRYTAPLTFSDLVVEEVQPHLEVGAVTLVRWKVPMFEEMAKLAIRRGDSAAVGAALQGLGGIVRAYVEASAVCPEARGMPFENDDPPLILYGWLGEDLREALARLGEDTLRQGAPSEDSDHTVDRMEEAARRFLLAGLLPEAKRMVTGLIALSCTTHQVGSGYINQMVRPAAGLARLVPLCARCNAPHVAAYSLAGWALAVSYVDEHFSGPDEPLGRHPNWGPGLWTFGVDPPWAGAAEIIQSVDWQRKWANQMHDGYEFVLLLLALAHQSHQVVHSGGELPTLPTLNELSELEANGE